MPRFQCQVCGAPFEVGEKTLRSYPGWTPKYCRAHSPKRAAAAAREENLTVAQVLERYRSGPTTGVFTDGSAQPNPGPER